jgi:DNA primase
MIPDPDLSRAYKDYLVSAFYQLVRPSAAEKKAAGKVIYRDRRARQAGLVMDQTPEARTSAAILAQAPIPIVAAIVEGLIRNPEILSEKAELLQNQSLGDQRIDDLVSDMVRLSFERDALDDGLFRSRLVAMGHQEILKSVDRIASVSHAPFLFSEAEPEIVATGLSVAISAILETQALERALEEMKTEDRYDSAIFFRLKSTRDTTKRRLISGALWDEDATVH